MFGTPPSIDHINGGSTQQRSCGLVPGCKGSFSFFCNDIVLHCDFCDLRVGGPQAEYTESVPGAERSQSPQVGP